VEVTGQEARFRAMFAEEAEGRLATLSELLLELERNGEDQDLLSSVFREAHTLKGAAAVVGLADVLRVAHAMEEILEGLRRGGRTATPATVDALLGAVDGMRELVPAVLAGADRATQADSLVAALSSPAPDPDLEQAAPEPRPPAPGPRRGSVAHRCRRAVRLSTLPRPRRGEGGTSPSGCRWNGWTSWSGWWVRRPPPRCGSVGWSPNSSGSSRPASQSCMT
jgi:chemotaxis protein histidine kinase CheA